VSRIEMPSGETIDVLHSGAPAFEFEAVVPPGVAGPPPHRHRGATESFTVLEGVLRVRVGGWTSLLHPGDGIVVPPGVTHSFGNGGDGPVRVRTVETPAGPLEEQFRILASAGRLPPLRRLARLNVAHDLDFSLAGIPDAVQRPLWRLLAALPGPS